MMLSKFASMLIDENQLESPNISHPDIPEPRLDPHPGPIHDLLGGYMPTLQKISTI
jgi:hypothetical protein